MTKRNPRSAEELRKRAEALLAESPGTFQPDELENVNKLAQELAVHQAELELQNEELRETQNALQETRDRFARLYEHAPVGYVVMDSAGIVRRANTTWYAMLNREGDDLRGTPFADVIEPEDAPIFRARFRAFFRNPADKTIAVRITRRAAAPFHARIEVQASLSKDESKASEDDDRTELMVTVSDVSELQAARERTERLNSILRAIRNVNQLITKEDDRQRLLQGACDNLTENLSYRNAWVALVDDDGQAVQATAFSGAERDFSRLQAHLERGSFPACMKTAMKQAAVTVAKDAVKLCSDCPMEDFHSDYCGLARRLESYGKIYGVLVVYVPRAVADDPEEHDLFEELAGDLAFALHKIELAEQKRESEQRIHSIFRSAPIGVGVVSDRILKELNPRLCEITGYNAEELINQSARLLYPSDEDYEYVGREKYTQIRAHGTGTVETRWNRKDGAVIDVLLSSTPIDINDPSKGVTFTALDITEWKQAEQALRESEERFQKLLADLPVLAVQGYQADGTTTYWNKGSEILYGYTADEAIGKSLLDLIIPSEMRDTVQRNVREMAETGVPHPSSELQLVRKDGSVVPVFSSHMVLQREGYPSELFCLDLDLTDIKRAEAERSRLREQLAQSQKLESIGRLAGGVAHDFNNLLMGIMNYADMCKDHIGTEHPIRQWLEEISSEAQRSANLTRQLLAFARKQTVSPQVLDVNDVVSGMLKMLRRLIGEDIDLLWQPGASLGTVKIDPGQIDQLLANLCVNARDAIAGVGKITIETANTIFDAEYCATHSEAEPGAFVMLGVSDDGCGMDKETLEHAFDPFYTTKGVGKGTGLGLATVYGIVRQNEGFINAYSEPGKGTTFRIYLPRCTTEAHPGEVSTTKTPEPRLTGDETILVVEDEKGIRTTLQRFLEKAGYTVLVAPAPGDALPLVSNHEGTIHLLITDVVMPGMSGRELAERLAPDHPRIRVLYISGYTANVIAHRGVLEDNVEFLAKPFTRQELVHKVREILDQP